MNFKRHWLKDGISALFIDLMPGTLYTVRMLASSRGGQGVWSQAVPFRSKGEARFIDMEAFATTMDPRQTLDKTGDPSRTSAMEGPNYRVPDEVGPIILLWPRQYTADM